MTLTLDQIGQLVNTDKGRCPARSYPLAFWHGYLSHYDRLFGNRPVRRVLELGVWDGASLLLWRARWPDAVVHGLDVNLPMDLGTDERLVFWHGSQRDRSLLARVAAAGPFDLIVDDASHELEGQTTSLGALFPAVADGGWYIIEDVERSALGVSLDAWAPLTDQRTHQCIPSTAPDRVAVVYVQ